MASVFERIIARVDHWIDARPELRDHLFNDAQPHDIDAAAERLCNALHELA